jgi:hypothetical protein
MTAPAFDGHVERRAHLSQAVVAESSQALDEDTDGHTLDGVESDRGSAGNWIVLWLENDLAGRAANDGRAWPYQCSSQPRDRCIPG